MLKRGNLKDILKKITILQLTSRKPFALNHNYLTREKRLIPTAVRTILKTKNELWLGTNHNGTSVYRNGNLYEKHPYYQSGFQRPHIRALFKDKAGNVWIGGVSGWGIILRFHREYPVFRGQGRIFIV
jgi:ligand-binding sensor domain-containing protein